MNSDRYGYNKFRVPNQSINEPPDDTQHSVQCVICEETYLQEDTRECHHKPVCIYCVGEVAEENGKLKFSYLFDKLLEESTIFAPLLSRSLTIDRPIPEDAPVIQTTLSLNIISFQNRIKKSC